MDTQTIFTGATSFSAVLGIVLTFLRSSRGRRAVAAFFEESFGLDDKINVAVEAAVEALKAALEARGQEISRLQSEIDGLQVQITELKTLDTTKSDRIAELEAEIAELRAENEALRAELKRRRGGRPRKDATPTEEV
jgi:peptidoglycan hydrolase CwlO-like protein